MAVRIHSAQRIAREIWFSCMHVSFGRYPRTLRPCGRRVWAVVHVAWCEQYHVTISRYQTRLCSRGRRPESEEVIGHSLSKHVGLRACAHACVRASVLGNGRAGGRSRGRTIKACGIAGTVLSPARMHLELTCRIRTYGSILVVATY